MMIALRSSRVCTTKGAYLLASESTSQYVAIVVFPEYLGDCVPNPLIQSGEGRFGLSSADSFSNIIIIRNAIHSFSKRIDIVATCLRGNDASLPSTRRHATRVVA